MTGAGSPGPATDGEPAGSSADDLALLDEKTQLDALQKFADAMYGLAGGTVDRARANADLVQKSSAAIATLYTGILALVFSVTSKPLPLRGALTPVFLGAAVVLATIYLAFQQSADEIPMSPLPEGPEPRTFAYVALFGQVTADLVTRRAGFLRAAVVALGVGLAFIPAPLIHLGQTPADHPGTVAVTWPAWPAPPPLAPGATANPFAVSLYQAQVTETASLRAAQTARPAEVNTAWDVAVFLGGLALGTVVIGAVVQATKPPPAALAARADAGGGPG